MEDISQKQIMLILYKHTSSWQQEFIKTYILKILFKLKYFIL